ncbi:ABC transporter permease [Candidatus Atribacteria bacterium RBG_19FT_COMBO_35_14]|uniref:sn-glycerol-3-phosphate transport system permease protein UgpE n=1 Tax=Candidatus Sediminicultor quintus TaxID=1797291 RepID=A0A1F5A6F9_9BACT|nr:MAG: ABC transporter permease [Candidatus Atribacteria bacterium RBG_19FT_COMBO_35_14]
MTRKTRNEIFIHAILILLIIVLAFPVFFALVTSTLSLQESYQYPPKLLPGNQFMSNLKEAWERVNIGRLFFNSTLISVVVAIVKTILALLAAFAYTHFKFRGQGLLFSLCMITQMLPLPVRIIPTYQLMATFNWINSYYALMVPFFASTTGLLLFRQFYMTVPADLPDAARVDGASPMRYFLQILVPISKTNIAALFVIEFIFMWSQYLWPLIVTTTSEMRVIQIGIKMLLASEQIAPEWNVIMAATVIAMLPPLIVLLVLRKSFVQGIAMQTAK